MLSFNTTVRQMTKMSQQKKTAHITQKCSYTGLIK